MPKVVVDAVVRFQNPAPPGLDSVEAAPQAAAPARLTLANGDKYTLDRDDKRFAVWAGVLERREKSGKQVYLEVDSADRVTRVLLPLPALVTEIAENPEDGTRIVRTLESPQRFFLRPGKQEELQILGRSMTDRVKVLVTTDPDTGEVLHVRPFEAAVAFTCDFPEPTIEVLTEPQDQGAFDLLASQTQIPFDYPVNCCTARAHEMCRVLRVAGFACMKIWNYGPLVFHTPLVSKGFVEWDFHVAPVVQVVPPGGTTADPPVERVLDPALGFTGPATVEEWKQRQTAPSAIEQRSPIGLFSRKINGILSELDPDCSQTEARLEAHRFNRDVARAMAQT